MIIVWDSGLPRKADKNTLSAGAFTVCGDKGDSKAPTAACALETLSVRACAQEMKDSEDSNGSGKFLSTYRGPRGGWKMCRQRDQMS